MTVPQLHRLLTLVRGVKRAYATKGAEPAGTDVLEELELAIVQDLARAQLHVFPAGTVVHFDPAAAAAAQPEVTHDVR